MKGIFSKMLFKLEPGQITEAGLEALNLSMEMYIEAYNKAPSTATQEEVVDAINNLPRGDDSDDHASITHGSSTGASIGSRRSQQIREQQQQAEAAARQDLENQVGDGEA